MTSQSATMGTNWWRGATLYQIYPRSFQDTNGDGIGDLNGIRARLDEVKKLGVDGVWISPFFKSPMKDFGYDVSDYEDVDPMFGTLQDFDALIDESHQRGIKVIIDLVLSHTSDVHPWFKQSRSSRDNDKADWYVWAEPQEDGTPPNNWLSIFGGSAWEWDTRRRQYYMHNFLGSQPDLNFHNPNVQDAVLAAAKFWLERGVDGFRLDTINFYFHDQKLRSNPPAKAGGNTVPAVNPYGRQRHDYDKTQPENLEFLKRLRLLLNEYGACAVGEVGDDDRSLETMAAYTSGNDKVQMCYSFELLGMDFSPELVRNTVEGFFNVATDGWPCWAFSNHDVMRHVSRWSGTSDKSTVAKFCIALLASLRGSLCLYQGEELAQTEADVSYEDLADPYGIRFWPDYKGRDGCRTPYAWERAQPHGGFTTGKPWLPVSAEHISSAFNTQDDDSSSVLAHYRTVLAARAAAPVLLTGNIKFLESSADLLVFERFDEHESRLCIFNFSTKPARYTVPVQYSNAALIAAFSNGANLSSGELHLAGFGSAML